MRVLIADDEAPARLVLRRVLEAMDGVEIVGEASNGIEAVEKAEALRPEVAFLDIEMPGLSGLDVAVEMPAGVAVVFVTAFDHYAVKAFETNAMDYLLKPVEAKALERALARVRARGIDLDAGMIQQLRAMLQPEGPAKLAGRRGKRIVLVARRDLVYASAEDRLVFLHTEREKLLTERTLGELEHMLPEAEFYRGNRGALVNLEWVSEMYPWLSAGAWRVKLRNGEELDVSRDRARGLREKVGL